ncbi:MAG TPA: thiamine phosphate synthase [Phycisphaerales bacterium]|nr:thiamine phosphate synthase [Phycisphaerales bacterium]
MFLLRLARSCAIAYNARMDQSLYRILDANFNRAREAARVAEEFCRFVLNSPPLSARAKSLRHRLCGLLVRIETERLAAARDTAGDVGRGLAIPGQMQRANPADTFTAAARRLTEALRALAEAASTFDPPLATDLEGLRFEAYDLEKQILMYADPARRFARVRLYVILTVTPDETDAWITGTIDACCRGGADCIQLRPKGLTDRRTLKLARLLTERCREASVMAIINDRVDIAVLAGADGVHLGQDDLPVEAARRLFTRPMIVGLSTHNPEQLTAAIEALPTYVALGPAYATTTKPHEPPAGLDYLAEGVQLLDEAHLAHVAIGGVTPDRLAPLLAAGVRTIAVGSAIVDAPDPEKACRTLKSRLMAS